MAYPRIAGLLGFALFLSACSTRLPPAGLRAFESCDFQQAEKIFQKKANEGDKDYAMYQLAVLSSAIEAGDDATAEQASLLAQRAMWSYGGAGKGTASLVSAEAIKIFKGEPFEKAMAAIYSGILYFNRAEYDNARASFSKAVLAIRQKEENREDFALAHVLQALVLAKTGESDNARIALESAQKVYPTYTFLTADRLRESNAIFVVQLGQAPRKTRTGPGASLIDWVRQNYAEQSVAISVDRKELGTAVELGDLTYQARSKGHTAKDTIQATKGVTREAAAITTVIAANEAARGNETAGWIALGAGAFALANQSQADTRQWELLPDRIHVLFAKVSPGKHTFQFTFRDSFGSPISAYEQSRSVEVSEKGLGRIYLVRSGACRR